MIRFVLAMAMLAVGVGTVDARATKGPPYLLEEGTWICATPEDYDRAIAEQAKTNGYPELMALKERLLEAKSCMFVDDEDIEDMMAPFVTVVDRQGDKVKVEFWVEFYKKHAELHRVVEQRQVHRLDRRGATGGLPPGRRLAAGQLLRFRGRSGPATSRRRVSATRLSGCSAACDR